MKQTWKRQPRIPGLKRDKIVSCILPAVLDGLEEIAASEGRSLSWVIHQLIGDRFQVDAATGAFLKAPKAVKIKKLKFAKNGGGK